jgi:cell wall assembly regulator SMI1
VAATSAGVDWRVAAAAVAAAAEVSVAAVVVGASVADDDPLRPYLAGLLELPVVDRLGLEQARDLVRAVGRAYDLVLVGAAAGLLVPVGRDDWTLADLASATGAPAVVVTGPGPDAVNHTTLALGALAGHGIAASVVTVGAVDEEALPVTPAGRIPAAPDDFAGAAGWLDPILRATSVPASVPPLPAGKTVNGKRLVLGLLAVFVVMIVLVCGMAWLNRTPQAESGLVLITSQRAEATPVPVVPVPVVRPRRSGTEVCPENAGRVAVARPDATTAARVSAAWSRIEKWLAAHAPASARTLRPGASAARIDAIQRRMSVAFPADLVASLRRHDGVTAAGAFSLPPFFSPEPLDSVLRDWQVTCGVLANVETDWPGGAWWDRGFVPFATAGDGGSLVVDQRPGGHGRVGEFYPEDGTKFEEWPASVAELLELTATSLETGRPFAGHYTPRTDSAGALDWAIK